MSWVTCFESKSKRASSLRISGRSKNSSMKFETYLQRTIKQNQTICYFQIAQRTDLTCSFPFLIFLTLFIISQRKKKCSSSQSVISKSSLDNSATCRISLKAQRSKFVTFRVPSRSICGLHLNKPCVDLRTSLRFHSKNVFLQSST